MAWCEHREGKKGVTYRIFISEGIDESGKQIIHRMTWKPEQGMTKRQEEKALQRVMLDFENKLRQGFQMDNSRTFAEYAEYTLDLKERMGLKPRTVDRYRELLVRINAAIGHKKLTDIRPQHLNMLYKNLSEDGICLGTERGIIKIDGKKWLSDKCVSRSELSRRSHVAVSTVSAFLE